MTIREFQDQGDYHIEIHTCSSQGDRARILERNNNAADTPLAICYNLGSDFNLRATEEKRARVLGMLKMLHTATREVIKDLGTLVGAEPLADIPPHETGEAGGMGWKGGGVQ